MNVPLDLGRSLIYPGRRLIGVVGKIKTKSDVLAWLLSDLESHGIKLRQIYMSSVENTAQSRAIIFLDTTESKTSVDELFRQYERQGLIEVEAVLTPPLEGFLSDTFSHPLTAAGVRSIIMRQPGYRELLVGLREWFGAGGEAFLYHVGYRTGLAFGELHRETAVRLGITDPIQIYENISRVMFQWAGFGILDVKNLTPDGGEILVRDSFECELGKGRVIPYSHFVRGIIAGILSELFGRTYNVIEASCIAKGDPVCSFVAKAIQKE
jgi:predicted hydrocarbon binding protein